MIHIRKITVLAVLAALAAVAATAPAAGAAPSAKGYKLATFKVEIKGVQKTVQQNHHLATDQCDIDNFSSGSETIVFRSTFPTFITAMKFPGEENPEFFAGKRVHLPVRATVERSYTPRFSKPTGGVECGDNGGGVEGEHLLPDCGKKPIPKWGMDLEYADAGHNRLMLGGEWIDDPFERCPGAGTMSFPFLLEQKQNGKPVSAFLSERDLFDPRFGKWISKAGGKYRLRSGDWWAETKLNWEVSFTRVKKKTKKVKR